MDYFGFSIDDSFKSDDCPCNDRAALDRTALVPTLNEYQANTEITTSIIRPSDLAKVWNSNEMISTSNMNFVNVESSGASILIFHRTRNIKKN